MEINKRIKENDIPKVIDILKNNNYKKAKIEFSGFIKQKNIIKNPIIKFNNRKREIVVKTAEKIENEIKISLSFVEEIYFKQKNKLKFLTENDLEILIVFF